MRAAAKKHMLCQRCEYIDLLTEKQYEDQKMYCNSLPIEYIRSKKQSMHTDKVQKHTHMHTHTPFILSDGFLHLNEAINGA